MLNYHYKNYDDTFFFFMLQSIGVHKPHLSETKDMHNFMSMPEFTGLSRNLEHSSSDDTLNALDRYLRPTPPLEKMLTPVEERPAAEYDREHSSLSDEEGEQDIVPSSSDKLDGSMFSRSMSGHSYPPTWMVGEDSERNSARDSTSILSSGYETPPRSILNSTNSMDISEIGQAQSMEEPLENHEEKASSQGSDDSSTFSESAPTTHYGRGGSNYNQVLSPQGSGSFSFSSAEGTPVRTMSETRKTHPARQGEARKVLASSFSDSTTHSRRSRPRSSPHSSNHSSVSRLTLSSQSSLGEDVLNPDATERRSRYQKKYGKYEKYERHEKRERSLSLDTSPQFERKNLESPNDGEILRESTQDSNGTLTDGNLETAAETLTEVELSSSHSVASMDSFYQNVNGQAPVVSGNEQKQRRLSSERELAPEGTGKDEVSGKVQRILDSTGFDDTNATVYKSISGESGQSSTSNNDGPDSSKPASYKLVFDSRDSMLTDSLNEDYTSSRVVATSPQHRPTLPPKQHKRSSSLQGKSSSSSVDRHSRATSEGSEPSVGSPAHVELIIEDGKPARLYGESVTSPIRMSIDVAPEDDLGPGVLRDSEDDEDDDSVHEFERSGSASNAPRSLEGPSFSRFARVPVHVRSTESKSHTRSAENPLYDPGSSLRQRACSLNDLDEVSSSQEESSEDSRNKRATSEITNDDPYLIPVPSVSSLRLSPPEGLPQSSSATDLQSSVDDDLEPIRDKAFGGSLRLEKKPKKGKGFVSTALRVLKITSSPSGEGKRSQGKGSRNEKGRLESGGSRENTASPAEYLTPNPTPRPYEEVRRMRMMSPEVMATHDDDCPSVGMRRSHSSDDILDQSSDIDSSIDATKVGPVYIVPEPTKTKRRKFLGFQTKSKSRSKGKERSESPVVLVDVQPRTRRVSVEPIFNPSSSNGTGPLDANQQKSPKFKRRRLPHFV